MVNKKDTKYKIGGIIHIGLPFKSHDGKLLKNLMCIFSIKDDDLALMPMSTFHSEKQKDCKLNYSKEKKTIFEYSEKHGNNKDGYLKTNQLYFLTKKECTTFNKIRTCNTMNKERFEELQDYVENLQKDKVEFLKKRILFENEIQSTKAAEPNNLNEIKISIFKKWQNEMNLKKQEKLLTTKKKQLMITKLTTMNAK